MQNLVFSSGNDRIDNGRENRRRYVLVTLILLWTLLAFSLPLKVAGDSSYDSPGLYKDGEKLLDFSEEIYEFSGLSQTELSLSAGHDNKILQWVENLRDKNVISGQGEYFNNVLECKALLDQVFSRIDEGLSFESELEIILECGKKLEIFNETLLNEYYLIEEHLLQSGFSTDKVERHRQFVIKYGESAERLLNLLELLEKVYSENDPAGILNVLYGLEDYFLDNVFEMEYPRMDNYPRPVMMNILTAPRTDVEELTPGTEYPVTVNQKRGYDPEDLDSSIDVQFTQEIMDLADSLDNSPVEIYNFVRDNLKYEAYLGSRKGSQQTLDHRAGNDCDQASLLIALLRISGIPARYASGTIEMTVEQAENWLGIDDPVNAASMLGTAGMDPVLYYSGGQPVAIQCKRTWVEAYLPFINYRGAVNDSIGYVWVPLDPVFKQYEYNQGTDIYDEISFDAEAFIEDYYSTVRTDNPIEIFKQDILDSLGSHYPGYGLDDLLTDRTLISEADEILPGTLPLKLIEYDTFYSVVPDSLRYYVRFHLYSSGTDLDYTVSLPEIAQKQLTITYIGATTEDQEIIDSSGGLFKVTSPYLVDLKPVLKIDGCVVATGTGSVMMGIVHNSDMYFTAPTGASNPVPQISNVIIAGNYQGIGIDPEDALPATFEPPQTSCAEDLLGQQLHQTALTYLNNVDVEDDLLADLMHYKLTNDVSEAIVENQVRVLYSSGLPITFDWKGMIVDADRKILGPFSVDSLDHNCDFMRISGADGSMQEHHLFESLYDEEAISTIKILAIASDSGINICEITSSISGDCPSLNQPSSVVTAINNALAQGHHVIIPEQQLTYHNWTGTAWIDLDPSSCAAGYIIAGGQNGGATVQEWDIIYPDLFCIEPIGPVTVSPSSSDDRYCAESTAKWTFTVPTIKYWGKDEDDQCQLLNAQSKDFPVKYTIKYIAEHWGPGNYVFKCGSYTTECGCTMVNKTVTIVKVDFPTEDIYVCKDKDKAINVTVTPAGSSITFESSNTSIMTVSGTAPNLTLHGVAAGTANIVAKLNGNECKTKEVKTAEIEFPTEDFVVVKTTDRTMTVTVTPSDAPFEFESDNTALATVSGTAPDLTVHGVAAGTASIIAKLDGEECETKEITTIEVTVTSLGFTADHDLTKWPSGPVYGKAGGNDVAVWTSSGTNDPSCYTRNVAPEMFAVFQVTPSLPNPISSGIMVRAKSGTTVIGQASGLILNGTVINDGGNTDGDVDNISGGSAIPTSNGVKTLNVSFTWEISVDGGTKYGPAGTSGAHKIHYVYNTPLVSPLYDKALDNACAYVNGAANVAGTIRQGIHGAIPYDPGDGSIEANPLTMYNGGGHVCADFANLMAYLSRSVGLTANTEIWWGGVRQNSCYLWVYAYAGSYATIEHVMPGNHTFTYHAVANVSGGTQDAALNVTSVTAQAIHASKDANWLTISTNSLPDGQVGNAYSQAIQRVDDPVGLKHKNTGPLIVYPSSDWTFTYVNGNVSGTIISVPVNWNISSGSLPVGINIDPNTGTISGSPTAAGTSSFIVSTEDQMHPTYTGSMSLQLKINP